MVGRTPVKGESPITYRFWTRNRLSERPGQEPLCVIERNLAAEAVRQGVKRVLGPRNLEERRYGTRMPQPFVELAAEPRRDDVISTTVHQQRRRNERGDVGDRRCLLIPPQHGIGSV